MSLKEDPKTIFGPNGAGSRALPICWWKATMDIAVEPLVGVDEVPVTAVMDGLITEALVNVVEPLVVVNVQDRMYAEVQDHISRASEEVK